MVRLRSIALSQFGATVGQSLGDHLVVASTLKLVRAGRRGSTSGGADLLDQADDLDVDGETHGDLDLGAMAAFGTLRLGVSVQARDDAGVRRAATTRFELERQARAGVALTARGRGSSTR